MAQQQQQKQQPEERQGVRQRHQVAESPPLAIKLVLQSAWRLLESGGRRVACVVFVYWPHCWLYNCICHGQLNSGLQLSLPLWGCACSWFRLGVTGTSWLSSFCDFSLMGLCKLCRSSSAFEAGACRQGVCGRGVAACSRTIHASYIKARPSRCTI